MGARSLRIFSFHKAIFRSLMAPRFRYPDGTITKNTYLTSVWPLDARQSLTWALGLEPWAPTHGCPGRVSQTWTWSPEMPSPQIFKSLCSGQDWSGPAEPSRRGAPSLDGTGPCFFPSGCPMFLCTPFPCPPLPSHSWSTQVPHEAWDSFWPQFQQRHLGRRCSQGQVQC